MPFVAKEIVEPRERRATTEATSCMDSKRKSLLVAVSSPSPAEMTDADLVLAVVEGNKAALRAVWDRYITAVRSTLRSCLGRDHAVEDLAQEVFLSFYRSAGRIRDPSALKAKHDTCRLWPSIGSANLPSTTFHT